MRDDLVYHHVGIVADEFVDYTSLIAYTNIYICTYIELKSVM
jgi:hypothetical protein